MDHARYERVAARFLLVVVLLHGDFKLVGRFVQVSHSELRLRYFDLRRFFFGMYRLRLLMVSIYRGLVDLIHSKC